VITGATAAHTSASTIVSGPNKVWARAGCVRVFPKETHETNFLLHCIFRRIGGVHRRHRGADVRIALRRHGSTGTGTMTGLDDERFDDRRFGDWR
jgi:hypothetical protein